MSGWWNSLDVKPLVWPVQPRAKGEWEMSLGDMMGELQMIFEQYENGQLVTEATQEWITVEELLRSKLGRIADSWEVDTTVGQDNLARIVWKVREQAVWIPWADRSWDTKTGQEE